MQSMPFVMRKQNTRVHESVCVKGRQKRLFGSITRPIKNVYNSSKKPPCDVINNGAVDRAYEGCRNEEQQLRNTQQRLSLLRGSTNNLRASLTQWQSESQNSKSSLTELQEIQDSVSSINMDFNMVTNHITNIWDAFSVLYTVATYLMNFELLIIPLNAIYEELTKENLLKNLSIRTITNSTLARVKSSLNIVSRFSANR